jgi:ABC-type sugar transport system substrate-binding protein
MKSGVESLRSATRRLSLALTVALAGGMAATVAASADDTNLATARSITPSEFSGPTTPAKAPTGLKVAAVTCLSVLRGCVTPANGVKSAGEALGWTVQIYDGGGTAGKQNAAILDAISWGAKIVVTVAIDPKLIQLALNKAKEAGVLVVAGSNGIDQPNPVQLGPADGRGFPFDVSPDYGTLGQHTAEWIIGDSGGKANIAIYVDNEFPSNLAYQAGLLEGLKKCGGCVVSAPINFSGTQVGTQLAQMTVDYLRTHPDTNYVFSPYDPAAAVQVAAIAQAGMGDNIKLIGTLGDQQNLDFIRKGHIQVADGSYDNEYMGWAIVDQAIRTLNKQPLIEPHNEGLPFVVLDKTNLPQPGKDFRAATGYEDKYLALWK